ncbi:hypothetical protein BGY98DRAFT_990959 [Russula aff. rugulosa BPL654]|nr:hypothetical protein BGY98DRAFT_990959 [Russula aff. rugulosa BPL654]
MNTSASVVSCFVRLHMAQPTIGFGVNGSGIHLTIPLFSPFCNSRSLSRNHSRKNNHCTPTPYCVGSIQYRCSCLFRICRSS